MGVVGLSFRLNRFLKRNHRQRKIRHFQLRQV